MSKHISFTRHILWGMFLGLIFGSAFRSFVPADSILFEYVIGGFLSVTSQIFIISMKMLVIPLIFVSLVCGTSAISDPKKLGSIGLKTLIIYVMTTAIAISLALFFAINIGIGEGANFQVDNLHFEAKKAVNLSEVIVNLFPENPFKAMSEGETLQVIIFAILIGVAVTLSDEDGRRVREWFNSFNHVLMHLISLLMHIAPIGVFSLIANLMAKTDFSNIVYLLGYFLTMVFVLFTHLIVVNSLLIVFVARLNPVCFFRKMFPNLLFAFSTSSSNATIPITLKTVTERLGVDPKVATFTVPLGATVNMDGTSIMQGVATVFIANIYGIDLSMGDCLMVVLTATLSSIGTAGVPGVGIITLVMVLSQVGIPADGIALIMGVDRLLDMLRTAVNVAGDAAVTCVIAKQENAFDLETYKCRAQYLDN